jgi:anti-sigma-K factor RskA
METESIHELTAAYALDALSPDEARAYEEHLARCERCRADLAAFSDTATALAHGGDPVAPPPALRGRILDAAQRERPNVVPLRPRWTLPLGTAAVVATAAAIALAVWATSLSRSLDDEREARADVEAAARIIGDPTARRISLSPNAVLYVRDDGQAAIAARGLASRPGKTYEAWVIRSGRPQPAGTFDVAGRLTLVKLTRRAPAGSAVAVTLEPRGGSPAPTTQPLFKGAV